MAQAKAENAEKGKGYDAPASLGQVLRSRARAAASAAQAPFAQGTLAGLPAVPSLVAATEEVNGSSQEASSAAATCSWTVVEGNARGDMGQAA